MDKEAFKAKFLSKAKLTAKLGARVGEASTFLDTAKAMAKQLPDTLQIRKDLDTRIAGVERRIATQKQAGAAKPAEAWVAMRTVRDDAMATQQAVEQQVREAVAAKDKAVSEANAKTVAVGKLLDEIRTVRRDVADAAAAKTIQTQMDGLRQQVDVLAQQVRGQPYDGATVLTTLGLVQTSATTLLATTKAEAAKPAVPGTARAATRDMVATVAAIGRFAAPLASTAKDAMGRTPMDHVKARLTAYDEHFVRDEAVPGNKQKNDAMRLAATVKVVVKEMTTNMTVPTTGKDGKVSTNVVTDPYVRGRLADMALTEFGDDIAAGIAGPANAASLQAKGDATEAVDLAKALVADDPLMKLLTGKIRPDDAVQRIRDMAEIGGQTPSAMFDLLRQQAEIELGSQSYSEVQAGMLKKDKTNGKEQNFALDNVTGELSEKQARDLVQMTTKSENAMSMRDQPIWTSAPGGDSLAMVVSGQQVHTVKKGDTLASVAAAVLPGMPPKEAVAKLRELNKVVYQPNGTGGAGDPLMVAGLADGKPLPVGATLRVPASLSVLDQLAPYLAAWDNPEPPRPTRVPRKDNEPAEAADGPSPLGAITPDELRAGAAKLKDPRRSDAAPGDDRPYIPAPGVGQEFRKPGVLEDLLAEPRAKRFELEKSFDETVKALRTASEAERGSPAAMALEQQVHDLLDQMEANEKMLDKAMQQAAEAKRGALNSRQHAHLRLLQRADEEDKQAYLAEKGQSVEEYVYTSMAARYGTDAAGARKLLDTVFATLKTVPITITFSFKALFEAPVNDGPAFGNTYVSEVVFSRGEMSAQDLLGRDTKKTGSAAITGGQRGGWQERGDNYMRWRRDKDAREARGDEMAFEDQQVFGAANVNFDKLKGGAIGAVNPDEFGESYGKNYYGSAHFLLRDEVRSRIAFAIRGSAAIAATQRKDLLMMVYDMLGHTANTRYLDAMVMNAKSGTTAVATKLDFEVHLYGGFDMAKDAKAIYLPPKMDKTLRDNIQRFADKYAIAAQEYGTKPDGLEVLNDNQTITARMHELGAG